MYAVSSQRRDWLLTPEAVAALRQEANARSAGTSVSGVSLTADEELEVQRCLLALSSRIALDPVGEI